MGNMYSIGNLNNTRNCTPMILAKIQETWSEIHNKTNVFRYRIHKLQEKHVHGYFLQLNPNRCSKRRTPENIISICEPFDKDKFNFTKVNTEEIIITLKEDDNGDDFHSILVNVSPISEYHSLLCPSVNRCLPQIVTEKSLSLAIKLMLIITEDRGFRIGFNSLCALASVNHLHYHLFVEKHVLPVENATCVHLKGPVYYLNQYPIPGFCFEVKADDCILEISKHVFKLVQHLLQKQIAHNIFFTKGQDFLIMGKEIIRIIVWPRKSSAGVKQLGAFNVAVCELSGWFPVYNANDFETLQASDLEAELIKWKIDYFEELCRDIKSLFD